MTLLFGIFISVSIEKKLNGMGIYAFTIWMGIIAMSGFWEYWLLVISLMILHIGKFYYGWIK